MENGQEITLPSFIIDTVKDLENLKLNIFPEIDKIRDDVEKYSGSSINSLKIAEKLKNVIDSVNKIKVKEFLVEYKTFRERHKLKNQTDTLNNKNKIISEENDEVNSKVINSDVAKESKEKIKKKKKKLIQTTNDKKDTSICNIENTKSIEVEIQSLENDCSKELSNSENNQNDTVCQTESKSTISDDETITVDLSESEKKSKKLNKKTNAEIKAKSSICNDKDKNVDLIESEKKSKKLNKTTNAEKKTNICNDAEEKIEKTKPVEAKIPSLENDASIELKNTENDSSIELKNTENDSSIELKNTENDSSIELKSTENDSSNKLTNTKTVANNELTNSENDQIDTVDQIEPVDQMNPNNSDSDSDVTENIIQSPEEVEDIKFGIIKCVDITKLMKPTLVDTINEKTNLTNNDSIILLSSDSETDSNKSKAIVTRKLRRKQDIRITNNNEANNKTSSNDVDNIKTKETRSRVSKSKTFESYQKARSERKLRHKQIEDSTSPVKESKLKTLFSIKQLKKKFDIKQCNVSLPKIQVEDLKDFYLYNKADSIIESSISMKRARVENSDDSDGELIRLRKNEKKSTTNQSKKAKRILDSDESDDEHEENKKTEEVENKENSVDKTTVESDNDYEEQNKSSSDSEIENVTKTVRRRIKLVKDSDDTSSEEEKQTRKEKKTPKKDEDDDLETRKKIRNVWNKNSLADATKAAAKEEEERKKRISDRQKLYNDIYTKNSDVNATVDKVILDFNEETKEELLSVHNDIVKKLKPHQGKGIQFMWTACFESLERAKNTEGSGCILAHCMGLGKTLQVIALIHTLLTNSEETKVRTVLVVCPLSTVLNWVSEFKKWLDDVDSDQVNVFDLIQYKQNYERLYQLKDWMKFGGVMIMGYDMFRNLSAAKGKRISKKMANQFSKVLLEPGPDLVVCDEGHLLKNEKTGISIAMNKLPTQRRIVLTGTPLQNNLKEYFCMVQFVKPNLLGTYKEYLNRFVNPITNGQYTDSTQHDIQIMRKRAHVLHKMLDAIVERRDYNVLAPFLPPKHEYVLFITLTEVQITLYREYLTKFARQSDKGGTAYLFTDFQEFQRICIHPRVLLDKSIQDRNKKDLEEDDDEEGSLKDFIDDDDSAKSTSSNESNSGSNSDDNSNDKKVMAPRRTRSNPIAIDDEEENKPNETPHSNEWWSQFCRGNELDDISYSTKIKLLFDILNKCELIGDKILVFSQSLYSLNLIEYFLARIDEATQNGDADALKMVGGNPGSWALGLDYFRLDGSTSCENRAQWCSIFNNKSNTRARLFLISTRAGGLGINLVAANRVIIFDVSWNPSYDIQSIFRVYRFGQTKPCYIYRFVTMGTMENKIYERQVTKQAISKRVIDEQQIDRHYNQNDLAELYAFNPIPDEQQPTPILPKDRLFADLLHSYPKEIFKYHEHNSLLEDKADEGLNEDERRAAWEEFENEKKAPKFNLMAALVRSGMYETLRITVQQDNPTWTPAQVDTCLPTIVQKIDDEVQSGNYTMYQQLEAKHRMMRISEKQRLEMLYKRYAQQSNNSFLNPFNMNPLMPYMNDLNRIDFNNLMQYINPQGGLSMPGTSAATPVNHQTAPRQTISEIIDLND